MSKRTYRFLIKKNPAPQGAWLLIWDRDILFDRTDPGRTTVALEDIESSSDASAWTTLAAAKRAASGLLDRHRLPWTHDGEGVYRAEVRVRG